jgi:hypothetical protein
MGLTAFRESLHGRDMAFGSMAFFFGGTEAVFSAASPKSGTTNHN